MTDLANEVLDRIYREKTGAPEEDEEEAVAVDNEEEGNSEGEGVDNAVERPVLRPSAFRPVHWWVFLLYGPWGAETFGYDVHPLLAVGQDMKPSTSTDSEKALECYSFYIDTERCPESDDCP